MRVKRKFLINYDIFVGRRGVLDPLQRLRGGLQTLETPLDPLQVGQMYSAAARAAGHVGRVSLRVFARREVSLMLDFTYCRVLTNDSRPFVFYCCLFFGGGFFSGFKTTLQLNRYNYVCRVT